MTAGLNVIQMVATAGSLAAVAGAGATVFAWLARRSAARIEGKVRAVTAAAITESTKTITDRIDKSDEVVNRRIDVLDERGRNTDDKLTRVELQFGPNGGGLRQTVDTIKSAIANLDGRFTQHVVDNGGKG